MLRKFVMAISLIVAFALQSTIFLKFNNNVVVPNLMIIFTATMGIMHGNKTGMIVGFCCGLLSDIFFGPVIGMYALIYTYIGFMNGFVNRIFNPEALKLPITMILGSDLIYSLITYLFLFVLRSRFHFLTYLKSVIIPELIFTILFTIVMYPLTLAVYNAFEKREGRGDYAD